MFDGDQVLSIYRLVSEVADHMLCGAQSGDWNELSVLEAQRADHLHSLAQGENAAVLAHAVHARKAEIIRNTLHSERAVRDLAALQMAELSAMINSTSTERRLAKAYDAPSF